MSDGTFLHYTGRTVLGRCLPKLSVDYEILQYDRLGTSGHKNIMFQETKKICEDRALLNVHCRHEPENNAQTSKIKTYFPSKR